VAWIDRRLVAVVALIATPLAAGCSGDGLVTSTGTVTCDGRPLADGAISFHPLEAGAASQGSRVVAGAYRIRGRPGRQRVEIVASRPKVGGEELTPGMQPHEQFLPPRYNSTSQLEAEVTGRGRNVFNFALQTELAEP
jgi:hypothetical protein